MKSQKGGQKVVVNAKSAVRHAFDICWVAFSLWSKRLSVTASMCTLHVVESLDFYCWSAACLLCMFGKLEIPAHLQEIWGPTFVYDCLWGLFIREIFL